MIKAIYISINPNAINKIIKQGKNHEFRNYIPKQPFDTLFVYVTAPISTLKYIININSVIKFPNNISYIGDGNYEFNNGDKSKFAYEIYSVHELNKPIKLTELKNKYNFTPPQSFAYDKMYDKLTCQILNSDMKLLFINRNIEEETYGK